MQRVIGIDLGTTHSIRNRGWMADPKVIETRAPVPPLNHPAFTNDGERLVGQAAKRRPHHQQSYFAIKRLIDAGSTIP
jgi:molecular chaperone DnaK (HSP70)